MMVQAARTEQASGAATNPMWQGFGPIGPRTPVGPGVGTDPGTPTTPGGPVTPTAKPAQGLTSGGNLDAATSTVPGGPTTPNARPAQGLTSGGSLDAATPTVAGGLTTPNATAAQGLTSGGLTSTAAGTLRTALSADDLLAKAPTANGPAPAQSTYNPVPRTPPAGGAPTDPASTPSDPSNGFSLGSYHPDKFTGDPAASTNPFATPQPLSLSTNGMFNGNFNLGGAPATPAGGNAQDPAAAAVDPDELLKRKAAMLAPAPVAPAPVAPVPNVPRGS